MTTFIEGKRAVAEALQACTPIECIYLADNLQSDELCADIQRKASIHQAEIKRLPRKKIDELAHTQNHQGIIAQIRDFSYTDLQNILDASASFAHENDGRALVILLDHINDAGNLGAIARSAEAIGSCGIIIPKRRQAQITPATYKSSAGAVAHLPVAQVANLAQTIDSLQKSGFWVAACSENATQTIWEANLLGKLCLVMGNEHKGISPLVLKRCDFAMKIPQFGQVESLNVAQACTVCAYEWLRQNMS